MSHRYDDSKDTEALELVQARERLQNETIENYILRRELQAEIRGLLYAQKMLDTSEPNEVITERIKELEERWHKLPK